MQKLLNIIYKTPPQKNKKKQKQKKTNKQNKQTKKQKQKKKKKNNKKQNKTKKKKQQKTNKHVLSTLVFSISLILNNRFSRSENLVPILTWKSNNRSTKYCDKRRNCSPGEISPLSRNIFNISLLSGVKLH